MNDDPIRWRGLDLSSSGALMYYRGRLNIDCIRGSVRLVDLDGEPALDEVLHSDNYEVEIRVIRRGSKDTTASDLPSGWDSQRRSPSPTKPPQDS